MAIQTTSAQKTKWYWQLQGNRKCHRNHVKASACTAFCARIGPKDWQDIEIGRGEGERSTCIHLETSTNNMHKNDFTGVIYTTPCSYGVECVEET